MDADEDVDRRCVNCGELCCYVHISAMYEPQLVDFSAIITELNNSRSIYLPRQRLSDDACD